jgi:hypothetical protein
VARCGGGGAAARAPALARVLAAGLRGGQARIELGDTLIFGTDGRPGVPRVAGDGVPPDRARYSPLPLKAPGGFGFRAFSLPAAARTISFTAADRKHRASNLKGEGSDPASTPGFVQPRSGERPAFGSKPRGRSQARCAVESEGSHGREPPMTKIEIRPGPRGMDGGEPFPEVREEMERMERGQRIMRPALMRLVPG